MSMSVMIECDNPQCFRNLVWVTGKDPQIGTFVHKACQSGWFATKYRQWCPEHSPAAGRK